MIRKPILEFCIYIYLFNHNTIINMFISALNNIYVKIGEMFTYIGAYVIRILSKYVKRIG